MEAELPNPIRVLVIDDDQDDLLIIKRLFSRITDRNYSVSTTSDFDEAKQLIDDKAADVYLIDYRLGGHTGLELLRHARPNQRREPFILLTGVGNERVEWQSLELAASDYLIKGSFDEQLLSRTVFYALQRKRQESQRLQELLELNRSKDEFISIASHQLRTPATGVKQYVGMLLEGFAGEITPQQKQLLLRAYESNERQLGIVSDLLLVARVDSGRVKIKPESIRLNELVGDVVHEQAAAFRERKQQVQFLHHSGDDQVVLDPSTIRMVIENIIDNARKYSPDESLVTVSIDQHDDDTMRIHIADQGVGISAEDAPRLFEKFSRLDNERSTVVNGNGLGLYWARKIVDLHGGTIKFRANEPTGTIFSIHLPRNTKNL